MINKEEFLKTCNLTEDDLTAARISWEELTEIYEDYMSKTKLFRHLGKEFVDEYIYDIERAGIHSYRYRTKNPMHLLEKIIRKRKENYAKFEHINKSNYHKYITDLIGIRVFFLYREDWIHFHKFITSMFENDPNNYIEDRLRDFDEDPEHCYIAERPKVYKRSGDTRIYDSTQIEVRTGGYYRSLHYIIKYHGYYLEIQGRTLFEEGWSEIDHDIVYPYYKDDEMLTEFSGLLNRLSGMADEMSSYFRESEPDKAHKGYAWSTAIGLQAVDGLKPSKYLIDTAIQNIEGKIPVLLKFFLKQRFHFPRTSILLSIANSFREFINTPERFEITTSQRMGA